MAGQRRPTHSRGTADRPTAPARDSRPARAALALLVLALVATLATACRTTSSSRGLVEDGTGEGTVLRVGLDDDPPGLDPAGNFLSVSALSIGNALYDTLLRAPSFGAAPEPALAASLTEAPDRLSWTLVVRDGVTFHDGTVLDAAAVKTNLDRQRSSAFNGSSLSPISDVVVSDARTVVLRLRAPWTALPAVLAGSQGMMLSPTAIAAAGAGLARAPLGAGTGPYQFVEWVPDDHLTVRRNRSYWDGATGGFDTITFRFLPDESTRLAAFQAGDLDLITSALSDTVRRAQQMDGGTGTKVQVVEPPAAGQTVLYLHTTAPPFDDVRVRRALLLALDLDALSGALGGGGYDDYSWSLLPKDSPWYAPPVTPLRFDPDEARRLVAAYSAEVGRPVRFTYLALSSNRTWADAGRAYAQLWRDVGMEVEVLNVPDLTTLVLTMLLGQFDVAGLVAGYYADPDTVLFDVYHSDRTLNLSGYRNARMDGLLEAARSEADPAVRRRLYAEVQQLAREEVPLLNGSFGTVHLIASAGLSGVEASGYFPARTIGRR